MKTPTASEESDEYWGDSSAAEEDQDDEAYLNAARGWAGGTSNGLQPALGVHGAQTRQQFGEAGRLEDFQKQVSEKEERYTAAKLFRRRTPQTGGREGQQGGNFHRWIG